MSTLGELGERRILREIIPRFADAIGDDCAAVEGGDGTLVITTDPVPVPAALLIGLESDLFWTGWLLVTINASDIAASGALPLAFVAALDLPRDLEVRKLERLLSGIRDSCTANGLLYVGGNLREADRVRAVGTAIGRSARTPLGRKGASDGDLAVVIGQGGRFWADVERFKAGLPLNKATSPLYSPVSQATHMHKLHAAGLVRCAMDTSDGLSPALTEMALANKLGIEVDMPSIRAGGDFADVKERSERLWMGWGDWTILAAVRPSDLRSLEREVKASGTVCTPIGRFVSGDPNVVLRDGDRRLMMGRLESERFASDSWFEIGIDEYRRRLQSFELP